MQTPKEIPTKIQRILLFLQVRNPACGLIIRTKTPAAYTCCAPSRENLTTVSSPN
jgi:hypothetical protein